MNNNNKGESSSNNSKTMAIEDDPAAAAAAGSNAAAAAAAAEAQEEAARQERYVRERLERKPSEQITLDDIIYEMQVRFIFHLSNPTKKIEDFPGTSFLAPLFI